MAQVSVSPEKFEIVDFDAGTIRSLAEKAADDAGLPADLEVRIEVNERTPLGRAVVESIDPVVLAVESGGFENPKAIRQMSEVATADVLGRLLFRVRDWLDPDFGAPPVDGELSMAQSTAWNCYAVGRLARLGYPSQRKRRQYHWRNRHGFTDVSDAVFDRIWAADDLTWSDLTTWSAEAQGAALPT